MPAQCWIYVSVRRPTLILLVAAVLAAGPPVAHAQDEPLPPSLFEPAPDAPPARVASDDASGAPVALAAVLLAGAAAAGYFAGSSRRTRRS